MRRASPFPLPLQVGRRNRPQINRAISSETAARHPSLAGFEQGLQPGDDFGMFLGDVVPVRRDPPAGRRDEDRPDRDGRGLVGLGAQEVDERTLGLLALGRGADARDEFPARVADGEHIALRAGDERLTTQTTSEAAEESTESSFRKSAGSPPATLGRRPKDLPARSVRQIPWRRAYGQASGR